MDELKIQIRNYRRVEAHLGGRGAKFIEEMEVIVF